MEATAARKIVSSKIATYKAYDSKKAAKKHITKRQSKHNKIPTSSSQSSVSRLKHNRTVNVIHPKKIKKDSNDHNTNCLFDNFLNRFLPANYFSERHTHLQTRIDDCKQNFVNYARCQEKTAILEEMLTAAKSINQKDALLNYKDFFHETALSKAVRNDNLSAINLLLEANASMGIASLHDGLTPLQIAACKESKYPILIKLLEKIASCPTQKGALSQKDSKGNTLLSLAVRNCNAKAVSLLIETGVCLKEANKDGAAPLHHAVGIQCSSIFDILLTNIKSHNQSKELLNQKDKMGRTPLFYAVQKNNIKITNLLLNAGADSNACGSSGGCTPLNYATWQGQLQIIKMLLSKEKSSRLQLNNSINFTLLDIAAKNFHVEIMEVFLDNSLVSKKDLNNLTTLVISALLSKIESHHFLHEMKENFDEEALQKKEPYWKMMSLLIRRGAKLPDNIDVDGEDSRRTMNKILSATSEWLSTGPLSPDSLQTLCLRSIDQYVKTYEDFNKLPLPKSMLSLLEERRLGNPE